MQKQKKKALVTLLAGVTLALTAVLLTAVPAADQANASTLPANESAEDPGDNQDPLLVSPGVWVLGSKAIEIITIHVAVPYSMDDDILLSVVNADPDDDSEIGILGDPATFADDRGELVIKFVPDFLVMEPDDMKEIIGEDFEVTVTINGEAPFSSAIISVKEKMEPNTPTEPDVIVLSGDKVRGEEGEGLVAQYCEYWDIQGLDCPYGTYNPFTD